MLSPNIQVTGAPRKEGESTAANINEQIIPQISKFDEYHKPTSKQLQQKKNYTEHNTIKL